MQIDFHHTVIYVLCRIAGMKSKYAEIVAYSSQQVDDAVYGHALKFNNGGVFRQTKTAHKLLSKSSLDVSEAIDIWIPFHFLPQGNTGDFKRDLITSPNSKSSQLLLEDIKKSANRPIALYKLGIGLHIYADTFSHQDFKGFYDSYNDVYLLTGVDESSNIMILINKIKRRLKNKFLDIPPVGHGQALTNPDIPYANWSYKRPGGEIIVVNNLKERFIPAIKNIHDFLCVYLEENPSFKDNDVELKAYDFYKEKLIELLTFQGNSDERHQNWLDKVNNNYFEFGDFDEVDTQLNYDKRNWFRRAVKAIEDRGFKNKAYNFHSFYKKDNFEQSDWVMFMRAASEHKYKIIHEILPACGVDAG